MEGLLIAEALRPIAARLPSPRLGWRFPDAYTFVLPLGQGALWLYLRPPNPRLAYREAFPPPGGTHSSFQELLAAKATGDLLAAEQLKLDRVVRFAFAAGQGFVSTPPVTLVAELTGRHCNLILLDAEGVILGVAREVTAEINRFRELRRGLRYVPPPPYDKLDPRTATDEDLKRVLCGRPLHAVKRYLDGFGPQLTEALARRAGLSLDAPLDEKTLWRLLPTLRQIVAQPSQAIDEEADLDTVRRRDHLQQLRQAVREALHKRHRLLTNRLEDVAKAREAVAEATDLRRRAEVLLAYAGQVPPGAREVTLTDFSGTPLTVRLEPGLSAAETAQKLFAQAKKREQQALQAETKAQALQAELGQTQALLAQLEDLSPETLSALEQELTPRRRAQRRTQPGIRYTSPQGFTVLVGRNAQENETVTFKLAQSRDIWLHAQGYPGSHVVIKAEGREVPFETILFAAQLAAGYSQARHSDNVPVDYTLKKYVWKPKGAAPGEVYLTQQKTVYVTPSRNPASPA